MKAGTQTHGDIPETYAELAGRFMPRPLHDEVDYRNALGVLDAMAGFDLNADQADYFEAVATFVEKYEARHHAIKTTDLTPVELLRSLMDEHGMSESDLGGRPEPEAPHPERRAGPQQGAHQRLGGTFQPRPGRAALARRPACRHPTGDVGRGGVRRRSGRGRGGSGTRSGSPRRTARPGRSRRLPVQSSNSWAPLPSCGE